MPNGVVIVFFSVCVGMNVCVCVQYMVVYECVLSLLSCAAFFVDGSSFSNLQVCFSLSILCAQCNNARQSLMTSETKILASQLYSCTTAMPLHNCNALMQQHACLHLATYAVL